MCDDCRNLQDRVDDLKNELEEVKASSLQMVEVSVRDFRAQRDDALKKAKEAERDKWRSEMHWNFRVETVDDIASLKKQMEQTFEWRDALRAKAVELSKALEPFANLADEYREEVPGEYRESIKIELGKLRTARAALKAWEDSHL